VKTRELTETNVTVARATKESLRVRYAELLRLREKLERLATGNQHRRSNPGTVRRENN
jgi:hypothetical protein